MYFPTITDTFRYKKLLELLKVLRVLTILEDSALKEALIKLKRKILLLLQITATPSLLWTLLFFFLVTVMVVIKIATRKVMLKNKGRPLS